MTTQSRPNRSALNNAIDIYRDTMRPFIVRCMKRTRGLATEDRVENEADIDVGDFPHLVRKYWTEGFEQRFDPKRDSRSRIGMIAEARNEAAHPGTTDLPSDYTLARLNDIADILGEINAPEERKKVEAIRDELTTSEVEGHEILAPTPQTVSAETSEDEPAGGVEVTPVYPASPKPKEKTVRKRTSNLTPWRDVIRPNSDVTDGTFRKSEFAANLQEVYEGNAKTVEYARPALFFNQTYITPGLRGLLINTLKRLGGNGGEPVIQVKTGFGGGKTHGLIALFHLVNGANTLLSLPAEGEYARLNKEIRGLMKEAEWQVEDNINARVSVLDGSSLSTTDTDRTRTGDPLNTLWGKMAEQLGGQDAYDIIGEAARQGISPGGNQLNQLFEHVGSSIILIDELVAYARNVQNVTRESIFTFVQNLTQSVRRSDNIALVITLPESKAEAGGEHGLGVLNTLETILERIEDVWEPLAVNESFEVVRRRLFGSEIDAAERDRTCERFFQMYRSSRREYPVEAAESSYLDRLKECYPIHPEIFDRLFQDWSMIHEFQRTRGVLRIMATCISKLYQDEDSSPMILPADLTLDYPSLADEFSKILAKQGGNWKPVVTEVDSDNSRTHQIDKASKNFLEVGAAAGRIARTVFLGSAATHAVRGISTRQIHLGAAVPGHGVAVYNDALNRMNGSLYYLYNLDDRYYFDAEANLNQVAQTRAMELTVNDIQEEIVDRLEKAVGRRSDVQVCPTSPSEVPDTDKLQLVILPPRTSLPSRAGEQDTAEAEALNILKFSGDDNQQRGFRNTLLFLTAKRDAVRDLENHVKRYMAWRSIVHGNSLHSAVQGLKEGRLKQANENVTSASNQVKTALSKAYRWALAPSQADPQKDEYTMSPSQTDPEDSRMAQHALGKLADDEAILTMITPSLFAVTLKRYIWSNAAYQDHIAVETLWELMARHVYMPRLKSIDVLKACIGEGVAGGEFGYADRYEEETYKALKLGESLPASRIVGGSSAVLVSPDMAKLQKEEIQPDPPMAPSPDPKPGPTPAPDTPPKPNGGIDAPSGPRHVVVTKTLREISLDEFDVLRDEIIRTLSDDGGDVSVQIIVTADKSDGFSENTARAVKQNSEHLGAELRTE